MRRALVAADWHRKDGLEQDERVIRSIKRLFEEQVIALKQASSADQVAAEHACRLAVAALLIEASRADFAHHPEEEHRISELLTSHFALSPQELEELLFAAHEHNARATSLYEFTGIINAQLDAAAKERMVRMLWDVAIADGVIDKHEDHLIRKLANLVHVPHSTFVRTKHEALADAQ